MKQIRIIVDTPFVHRFDDNRKSWYGAGIHNAPAEVAVKAVAEGKARLHRYAPEK